MRTYVYVYAFAREAWEGASASLRPHNVKIQCRRRVHMHSNMNVFIRHVAPYTYSGPGRAMSAIFSWAACVSIRRRRPSHTFLWTPSACRNSE